MTQFCWVDWFDIFYLLRSQYPESGEVVSFFNAKRCSKKLLFGIVYWFPRVFVKVRQIMRSSSSSKSREGCNMLITSNSV